MQFKNRKCVTNLVLVWAEVLAGAEVPILDLILLIRSSVRVRVSFGKVSALHNLLMEVGFLAAFGTRILWRVRFESVLGFHIPCMRVGFLVAFDTRNSVGASTDSDMV